MKLDKLCEIIGLQADIRKQVITFDRVLDNSKVKLISYRLMNIDEREEARTDLKNILGEDPKGIKMLTIMLNCGVQAYSKYKELEITDKIYTDTMKCFTRFINEHKEIHGYYGFDMDWWAVRHISLQLFRIGDLEFELAQEDNKKKIDLHIPSDAIFTNQACDKSLDVAKGFIESTFPDYSECEYTCYSWLLSPVLKDLLPNNSNIVNFQNRFNIISFKEDSEEYYKYVYKKKVDSLDELLEDTSLQREIKKHLLAGGKVGEGYGILK